MSNLHSAPAVSATPARRSRATLAVLLACPLLFATSMQAALAQSTGTVAAEGLEEIVVTGRRVGSIAGVLEQSVAKSRISISGDSLLNDTPGQTVIDSLNLVPGLNFTNSDAYGSSGGNIRLRSFDGSRVSLTFDGLPLNDTGNYASYTNQLPDSELIERVDVNLGTTDVDSPTASATGGTIAWRTRKPREDMGGDASIAVGTDAFHRFFGRFETGQFGPWGTTAFIAGSYTRYDKFKGPGEIFKRQINARIQQDFDNGNFVAISFHFNRNQNNQYRSASASDYRTFGRQYDNDSTCSLKIPTPGVADVDTTACSNYFGNRINPSDTGNIRINSLWHLADGLRFSFEPSVQYTLANGGGRTTVAETPLATAVDKRIIGTASVLGFDINGDGDIRDTILAYTPNNTNTRRYGLNASLIWDVSEQHRLRLAYTLDYGKHRQTAEWGYFDASGNPQNDFAGRQGRKILTADGSFLRGRDRYSIAELNQVSADYRGKFLDEKLTVNLGVRAPFFKRELNQNCYTQNGGNGNSGQVLCTTQLPLQTLANGNVIFSTAGTPVEYIAPYAKTLKFEEVLPNVGVTYALTDNHSVYASFASGLSAPRTDNLYAVRRQTDGTVGSPTPESETTDSFDLGWRYTSEKVLASVAVWKSEYKNRIASAFDPDLGFNVDRNLGNVDLQGIDMQVAWEAEDGVRVNASASYIDTELLNNTPGTTATAAPIATKGKSLVETPKWTVGMRAEADITENLSVGIQGKFVDKRFASDLNDYVAKGYTVVDLDMGYQFEVEGLKGLSLRLNVSNLFNEEYFGSISSSVGGASVPFYLVGAPRTTTLSLRTRF